MFFISTKAYLHTNTENQHFIDNNKLTLTKSWTKLRLKSTSSLLLTQ